MTQVAQQGIHLSNFSLLEENSSANGHAWLRDLRRSAMDRFKDVGFPSNKVEQWRHTNVAPIAKIPFTLGQLRVDATTRQLRTNFSFGDDQTSAELVFINGQFVPEFSQLDKLPRGVTIRNLDQALAQDGAQIQSKLGRYADVETNPFVA